MRRAERTVTAVAHYLFWPFDIGESNVDKERGRARTHLSDSLRLGVLAEEEGAELRIEGHLMACEFCEDAALSLWSSSAFPADPPSFVRRVTCPAARNAVLRHLEQGRPLEPAALSHLRRCEACYDHFLAPAKARTALEMDDQAIGALD